MIRIVEDDLHGSEVAALLQAHLDAMHENSPPQSVHALDLEALRSPEITFWTAWEGTNLAGCGALRALDPTHGEIKSMRTATPYLRQGVAAQLLAHIIGVARAREYRRLSLETGSNAPFMPAHALYKRFGFEQCSPFATYGEDAFSRYFTRAL